MLFDSLTLAAVTAELQQTLVGGRVEKVWQSGPCETVLRFSANSRAASLLLSCDPEQARVHLTTARVDTKAAPLAFGALLRKHLDGAVLQSGDVPGGFGERALHLRFLNPDGAAVTLVAETMGRHSNLVLTDGAGAVLGAAKHVGRDINRVRQTLPGALYLPPPPQMAPDGLPRRDPLALLDAPEIGPFPLADPGTAPLTPEAARAWLVSWWAGVGPLLASETVLRVPSGTELTGSALQAALRGVLQVVRTGAWSPRLWRNPDGSAAGAYPIALLSVPGEQQSEYPSISAALQEAAASVGQADTGERDRERLLAAVRTARKRREREAAALEQGILAGARADEYQQAGELLLAHQHAVARGQTQVDLPDYFAPPAEDGSLPMRRIALDPALSVGEAAERLFQRSRKARASLPVLAARLAENAAARARLTEAEQPLSAALPAEAVARIGEKVADLLPTPAGQARGSAGQSGGRRAFGQAASPFEGHKIKTLRSPDGWDVLVGESATANDYLTTKVARPGDVWLHARAAASAHAIIRTSGRGGEPSPAALQFAAEQVAARSESKHAALVPVDYTFKKYVRKPRKSAPGAVVYERERTVYVSGIHG